MRNVIPNPAEPDYPGYVVESHEVTDAVMLEADGVRHWLDPRVSRRIAQSLLQAAARVDPRPIREPAPDEGSCEG